MRKVEQAMLRAIHAGNNATMGDTAVMQADGITNVYLRGRMIARNLWLGMGWEISLSGHNTAVARSRLTVLLNGFTDHRTEYPKGVGVSSRKGVVRIHDARGETEIDATGWHQTEMRKLGAN